MRSDVWHGSQWAAGASRTFRVERGSNDLRPLDCSGITVAWVSNLYEETTLAVGGLGRVALLLDNRSASDVCYVYISPADSNWWTDDWLDPNVWIAAGGRRLFSVEPGTYDLLAQDCYSQATVTEEHGVVLGTSGPRGPYPMATRRLPRARHRAAALGRQLSPHWRLGS